MLLSKIGQTKQQEQRMFTCKTCNKEFTSFQALGGHRASHKKPRLVKDDALLKLQQPFLSTDDLKPKTHECSVCGLEFAIGQALGGHMRRHRNIHHDINKINKNNDDEKPLFPVMKKSASSKRILCLDLNLTPMENIDLTLQLGKVAVLY